MKPPTHRLFVAVELPSEVRAALAGLRGDNAGLGWVREEQLHLTVRFIGAVSTEMREAIASAVRGFAFLPFEMKLAGAGAFPVGRAPEVLWIGVSAGEAALGDLRSRVDALLEGAGVAAEMRAFHPHITMARVRDRQRGAAAEEWVRRHAGYDGPRVAVSEVTLFKTHFGRPVVRHEALARSRI